MNMKNNTKFKVLLFIIGTGISQGCDDFVKIAPPRTDLVRSTVFSSNATAEAAVVDVYFQLRGTAFANGDAFGVSFLCAISADEFVPYADYGDADYQQISDAAIPATNQYITGLWTKIYSIVYRTNAILEGLAASKEVSQPTKDRLSGEAYTIRAFCYFYLVNLWGDVPLVLTSDYQTNNSIGRTASADVYKRIVSDLLTAQSLLPDTYALSGNQRVRVNKWVATALLARAYLFIGDWVNAESSASALITNSTLFALEPDLTKVFLNTSREPIWQLWSSRTAPDQVSFLVDDGGPYFGSMPDQFAAGFEPGDARQSTWVGSVDLGTIFYFASKYTDISTPPKEYSTVLRLAEQYLIRAEARAQQNNVLGASDDINEIRSRSSLPPTTAASREELLDAVLQERRSELFTEWGHRWLDLKRTGKATAVLSPIKPDWSPSDELYPIPSVQILNDPAVKQNP